MKTRTSLFLSIVLATLVLTAGACRRSKSDETAAAQGGPGCAETNVNAGLAPGCMACLKKYAINGPEKDGCCGIQDPSERQLCADVAACMRAGGPPTGPCNTGGDTVSCFCGTHGTTCTAPGGPNGPCVKPITKAAGRNIENHTTDTPTEAEIMKRYGDVKYALGRASNVASIAGAFCASECGFVK